MKLMELMEINTKEEKEKKGWNGADPNLCRRDGSNGLRWSRRRRRGGSSSATSQHRRLRRSSATSAASDQRHCCFCSWRLRSSSVPLLPRSDTSHSPPLKISRRPVRTSMRFDWSIPFRHSRFRHIKICSHRRGGICGPNRCRRLPPTPPPLIR